MKETRDIGDRERKKTKKRDIRRDMIKIWKIVHIIKKWKTQKSVFMKRNL